VPCPPLEQHRRVSFAPFGGRYGAPDLAAEPAQLGREAMAKVRHTEEMFLIGEEPRGAWHQERLEFIPPASGVEERDDPRMGQAPGHEKRRCSLFASPAEAIEELLSGRLVSCSEVNEPGRCSLSARGGHSSLPDRCRQ